MVADSPQFDPDPGRFDAATGVFRAQACRPAVLGPVDPGALTPRLRALLVIDGTVTKFLEAYEGEAVQVTALAQRPGLAGADAAWLDCAAEDAVLRRTSLLRGVASGRLFAWADSVILPDRLSPAMRQGLRSEPMGLGQILLDSGLETRREGLWYGRETPAQRPEAVRAAGHQDFLSRTYRVISGGRPLLLITERFPLEPPYPL